MYLHFFFFFGLPLLLYVNNYILEYIEARVQFFFIFFFFDILSFNTFFNLPSEYICILKIYLIKHVYL